MDELCKLLSQTHLSTEISSTDDITKMIQQLNINDNNSDINIDDFTNLFNDMEISDYDIIEIANKSNNLSDFCKLMLSIVNQRYGQRCYQMTFNALPIIY